jgi:hypothetical protein
LAIIKEMSKLLFSYKFILRRINKIPDNGTKTAVQCRNCGITVHWSSPLIGLFNVLVAQLYNNTKNQAIVNQEQVKRIVSL